MTVTDTATPPDKRPARFRGGPWGTLVAIAFGVMMVALDGTIVAVANPAIGADLNASLAELQWVTHGYLLGLAVFLITAGKLGDRYGHRKMYLIGVVGFVAASIAIALSSGIVFLVAFRILQGLSGAVITPAAMGLLRSSFPAHKLGRAFGVFGSLIGGATAAGPIVGGILVSTFGWQSVFYINVPVGLAAIVLGVWLMGPNRATDAKSRFDLLGVVLLSVAMFALVWALVEAPVVGWTHPETLVILAAAVVFGTAFVLWQQRVAHPLLPLGIFRSLSVSIGTVLMILMALGLMGSLFFVTFYLQGVHGLSPLQTGLQLLPLTATMAVSSTLAGRLMDAVGTRVPTAAGLLSAAAGLLLLSRLSPDTGTVYISLGFVLLGAGLSFVMTGATAAIIGNAPVAYVGVAAGVQQAAMQLGGSLGTAVLGAMMSVTIATTLPGHYTDAGLTAPTDGELGAMQSIVTQGGALIPDDATSAMAAAITRASNLAFMDGMHLAFLTSGAVMVFAAALSLLMKPAPRTEEPAVHI